MTSTDRSASTASPHSGEKTSGLRAALSLAPAYRAAQWAIGADRFRTVVANEFLVLTPSDSVLDIGCGTADILEHLPEMDYVGFDPNPRYVKSARARFGARGKFVAASTGTFDITLSDRTLAMAIGVLHHLDDCEAQEVYRLAAGSLTATGRFFSIDPTLVDDQHPLARFLARRDRGQHVRSPTHVAQLMEPFFGSVTVTVRHDLLRVPYSHVLAEAHTPLVEPADEVNEPT